MSALEISNPLPSLGIGSIEKSSLPKEISFARMLAFSGGEIGTPGWPASNLHTDLAKAQRAGLPNVIASGIQAEAYLIALLLEEKGEGWLSGGTLSVKHVGMLSPGDTVVSKIRSEEGNGGRRLSVRCERPDGRPVVVGEAGEGGLSDNNRPPPHGESAA